MPHCETILTVSSGLVFFSRFTDDEIDCISRLADVHPDDPIICIIQAYSTWQTVSKIHGAEIFEKARRLGAVNPSTFQGLEVGVNSWFPGFSSNEYHSYNIPPKGTAEYELIKEARDRDKFTVLCSCDEGYFNKYGEMFMIAVDRMYGGCHVHLDIVAPSDDLIKALSSADQTNLSVSILRRCPRRFPAYYACRRFFIAHSLLRMHANPMIVIDIDMFPVAEFARFAERLTTEAIDVCGIDIKNAWMPWNKHIVNNTFFNATDNAEHFLLRMTEYMDYAESVTGSYGRMWFVDQNAFYIALEECLEEKSFSFADYRRILKHQHMYLSPNRKGKIAFSNMIRDYARVTNSDWSSRTRMRSFFQIHGDSLARRDDLARLFIELIPKGDKRGRKQWGEYLLSQFAKGGLSH